MQRFTLSGRGHAGHIHPDKKGTWCKFVEHELEMTKVLDREFEAMKKWLGQGECDIDLLIVRGTITRDHVRQICQSLVDSPWYEPKGSPNV